MENGEYEGKGGAGIGGGGAGTHGGEDGVEELGEVAGALLVGVVVKVGAAHHQDDLRRRIEQLLDRKVAAGLGLGVRLLGDTRIRGVRWPGVHENASGQEGRCLDWAMDGVDEKWRRR